MNYLAHAWSVVQSGSWDPYELAGVAVPDWLGVTAKRTKCRSRSAQPHLLSEDPRLAALARGVCRHHADDAWFHDSPAFGALSLGFAKTLRESLGESTSLRPWFLGHILVELLLDDELAKRTPGLFDRYYTAISRIDAEWVEARVGQLAGRDVGRLGYFIGRYIEVRFLEDYRDDASLTLRLNQVMKRVGLDPLPDGFPPLLTGFRGAIAASFDDLLMRPLAAVLKETGGRTETVSTGSA
ncbi:hypothetical protein Pla108_34880 [Botrimarina colliarenosi]|uniref:Acyl carrier protein phosphodiesterase n=1 Tax=Botrimarina colliarenosi TaxID=2528001 RepID=A0A5C6A5T0_9BACT|nr:hypothetical protein [Botrimarina colliarenosi]TWT95342.1 hypothetical protein Pla108_34880 [Botrimarina colliarenosi]